MDMELLERDQFVLALDELLCEAAAGHGRSVLVSGEAGIGKTALVERFVERRQIPARTLWGACEALFTPRPLGPLYDIAVQTQTRLRDLLDGEVARATLFAAVLDELAHGPLPTILVIEDIHWADEATLDLVKFLARRIHHMPALLVLTYRDDDVRPDHPLWLVLGDLPARDVRRLRLSPLSEAAIATLACKAHRPADHLYATTGGNPFFVIEALATDEPGVPISVREAVLARVARLTPDARCFLELAAVEPTRIERWAIDMIAGAEPAGLEECLATGMLRLEDGAVAFRHELARQAVEGTLSPPRRRALHAQVLGALLDRGIEQVPLARLVHHAAHAEDAALVLRFAPVAAKQASAQGAHRAAAAHYAIALRYADLLDAEQRAGLLEESSYEWYLTGRIEDAVPPREAALAIWRALDQKEKVGHNLRRLSRLNWFRGQIPDAERHAMEAVQLLETLPPGRELAMAYGNLSHLRMFAGDTVQTQVWGMRAIELADRLDDVETVSYALNNIGTAELAAGDERGQAKLERSLQLALEHGFEEHVARAYANLAAFKVSHRDFAQADGYLLKGIAYCAERDLGSWGHCLRGCQARARLERGDWAGADEDATVILSTPWADGTNRVPALLILGWLRVRRGDPGAEPVLDEARDLAVASGDVDWIVAISAARAEWRWLQGHDDQCHAEAEVGYQQALRHNDPWYLGEMAFWLWRGGHATAAPERLAPPFALHMAGNWRVAAKAWEQIGCPYQQALALADGDEAAQREALLICERLGARPLADRIRLSLRQAGTRGLPRGPRPTTRINPGGLTNRQLETLVLLAEGLHNAEIAERLATSLKTVDHHVSAVLAKLEVRSRAEAVGVAHELGLVPRLHARRR
jgi:DNA-binding CsgD family transcriptional regulator